MPVQMKGCKFNLHVKTSVEIHPPIHRKGGLFNADFPDPFNKLQALHHE